MVWKVWQEELAVQASCVVLMLLSGSVGTFEQTVTVSCSAIVLFLFFIHKALTLYKMINATTVFCLVF